MAITRRQFVTRLSALAAAVGIGQSDLTRISEVFAHGGPWTTAKPKVIWVHGAECTGCSTSLLSFFEDVRGVAIEGANGAADTLTVVALDKAVGGDGVGSIGSDGLPTAGSWDALIPGHRTLQSLGLNVDGSPYAANIADVVIDFIDLQYHETIMGMGGDLAYQYLKDAMDQDPDVLAHPFVLVVEGAVQFDLDGGFWGKTGDAPWCAIGMDGVTGEEAKFDAVVGSLATQKNCVAVIPIGQCACFGGYPACKSPILSSPVDGKTHSQTPAYGVQKFLELAYPTSDAKNKVVNVPGCPTNPWWFILTVVAWMIDATKALDPVSPSDGPLGIVKRGGALNAGALDRESRLRIVYGTTVHGNRCPNYKYYVAGTYAKKPGDTGCLAKLGCKGPATKSLCPRHGWNNQQPQNDASWNHGVSDVDGLALVTPDPSKKGTLKTTSKGTKLGGFCVAAGAPCMGCTEQGYPDAFVPFVHR